MKHIVIFMLFLNLGLATLTSCTYDDDLGSGEEHIETVAGDPPPEETGQDGELGPQ